MSEVYPAEAVERAADGALEWLAENRVGYPRTWAAIEAGDARRGYKLYDEFEAPPIAGYEYLEHAGKVVRGDIKPSSRAHNERVEFRLVETPRHE